MWTVICLKTIGGLIVTAVIKYADKILKDFANAIPIISSTICSYYILNDSTNSSIEFTFGATVVILATFLYISSPAAPKRQDDISGISVYRLSSSKNLPYIKVNNQDYPLLKSMPSPEVSYDTNKSSNIIYYYERVTFKLLDTMGFINKIYPFRKICKSTPRKAGKPTFSI